MGILSNAMCVVHETTYCACIQGDPDDPAEGPCYRYELSVLDLHDGTCSRRYILSKRDVHGDVCLTVLSFWRREVINNVKNMYKVFTHYPVFRVMHGPHWVLIYVNDAGTAGHQSTNHRRISDSTSKSLWRFMCSYRFDILEYLAELGIAL